MYCNLKTKYDKVVLVRSLIPTREIGFLPGDEEDNNRWNVVSSAISEYG